MAVIGGEIVNYVVGHKIRTGKDKPSALAMERLKNMRQQKEQEIADLYAEMQKISIDWIFLNVLN